MTHYQKVESSTCDELSRGVQSWLDICYHSQGPSAAHARQYLDVYVPLKHSRVSLFPIVIFVHGGGWRRFDRRSALTGTHQNVGRALAQRGFVAVLPSYSRSETLPPAVAAAIVVGCAVAFASYALRICGLTMGSLRELPFGTVLGLSCLCLLVFLLIRAKLMRCRVFHPAHVQDVAMAVHWTIANIGNYGGDAEQLVLCGNSSGGHIATMLALPTTDFLPASLKHQRLKGLIVVSGVLDGARFAAMPLFRWFYLLPVFGDDQHKWESSFPLYFCHDSKLLMETCPVLLAHSDWEFGLTAHTYAMAEKLRAANVSVQGPLRVPGENHLTLMYGVGCQGSAAERVLMPAISDFVCTVCSKPAAERS